MTYNYTIVPVVGVVKEVLDVIGDDGIIAGGCARLYARKLLDTTPPEPRDIDIFHTRKGTISDPVKPSLVSRILSLPRGYKESRKTIHSVEFVRFPWLPIQVVSPHESEFEKMYGSAEEVLSQFDFTINQFALQKRDGEYVLIYTDEAIRDNNARQLVVNHVNAPLPMAHRVAKYVKKGYSIKPRQWVAIFEGWDARPQEYKDDLKYQAHVMDTDAFEYVFLRS